ncbi:hypothetical protein PB2503_03262 [Parvularcula bermudensis HTCC2503]|uniref:Uncharacterized protein n=1 Tax=Parvularcula bermudensis (strain ATCC BAA-594 / HTCC2503 / KCTC 12087) TaxID=314260 RepID=E0TDH3_PARBH|nr:hypothetical protein PB2503_03262 [Parvularcula bermudensis HTCC2503]
MGSAALALGGGDGEHSGDDEPPKQERAAESGEGERNAKGHESTLKLAQGLPFQMSQSRHFKGLSFIGFQ